MPAGLKKGDRVSVQVGCFGEDYARGRLSAECKNPATWRTCADVRDTGVVVRSDGAGKWFVDFEDGEEPEAWKHGLLRIEQRAAAPTAATVLADSSDEEALDPTPQAGPTTVDTTKIRGPTRLPAAPAPVTAGAVPPPAPVTRPRPREWLRPTEFVGNKSPHQSILTGMDSQIWENRSKSNSPIALIVLM